MLTGCTVPPAMSRRLASPDAVTRSYSSLPVMSDDHLVGRAGVLTVDLAAGLLLELGHPVVGRVGLAALDVAGPGDDVDRALALARPRRAPAARRGVVVVPLPHATPPARQRRAARRAARLVASWLSPPLVCSWPDARPGRRGRLSAASQTQPHRRPAASAEQRRGGRVEVLRDDDEVAATATRRR